MVKKFGPKTINEIDADLRRRAMRGDPDVFCPCCNQRVAVKMHCITANLVDFLRRLAARKEAFGPSWWRTSDIVTHVKARHQKRSSDGPSARYWGLILACDDSVNEAGAPVGSYWITEMGLEFLQGKRAVPFKAFVLNGELWTTSSDSVMVNQVSGVSFNYPRDVLGLAKELKKIARNREIDD